MAHQLPPGQARGYGAPPEGAANAAEEAAGSGERSESPLDAMSTDAQGLSHPTGFSPRAPRSWGARGGTAWLLLAQGTGSPFPKNLRLFREPLGGRGECLLHFPRQWPAGHQGLRPAAAPASPTVRKQGGVSMQLNKRPLPLSLRWHLPSGVQADGICRKALKHRACNFNYDRV